MCFFSFFVGLTNWTLGQGCNCVPQLSPVHSPSWIATRQFLRNEHLLLSKHTLTPCHIKVRLVQPNKAALSASRPRRLPSSSSLQFCWCPSGQAHICTTVDHREPTDNLSVDLRIVCMSLLSASWKQLAVVTHLFTRVCSLILALLFLFVGDLDEQPTSPHECSFSMADSFVCPLLTSHTGSFCSSVSHLEINSPAMLLPGQAMNPGSMFAGCTTFRFRPRCTVPQEPDLFP